MFKKNFKNIFLASLMTLSSFNVLACGKASAYDTPEFCQNFQEIAKCHCVASGLTARMCSNVPQIYNRMISAFGSIERACRFQKDTSVQNCVDAWQCYQQGGQLADGRICNGTGLPCG
jgi:hypothetical protein